MPAGKSNLAPFHTPECLRGRRLRGCDDTLLMVRAPYKDGYVFIDPRQDKSFNRGIYNAIVTPRPIGWMSTRGLDGKDNLAPFSHFNLVSTAPPVLMFSCNTPSDRPEKDTLANIRATGEFVYNLATYDLMEAVNTSSTPAPYGTDEFALAGLEKAKCMHVAPPRVAASPVSFECKLLRIVTIEPEDDGDTESHVVFGRIIGMHIQDEYLLEKGRFDTARARPISRLGGIQYAPIGEIVELPSAFRRVGEKTGPERSRQ